MVPLQPMSARVPQRTHLVAGLGRSIRRDVIGIAGAFGVSVWPSHLDEGTGLVAIAWA